jgi:DNA-binding MarR family transcriptional regulator
MPSSLLSLPTEERIMLYLSDFKSLEEVYEASPELTQKEIARGVNVQRKHISRYLKKLVESELIMEKRCHVMGAKQRMKCYYLSGVGARKANDIRKYVGNKKVKIKIDGKIKDMLVSEIDGATSVHLTLSDIVSEAVEAEKFLDRDELERIEERKRREVDERTRKADIYLKALAAAWRSGVLTPSEKHLIDALKEHLGVTDEEHDTMEAEIIKNMNHTREGQIELYVDLLKEIGDKPTKKEERILEIIKERFNID